MSTTDIESLQRRSFTIHFSPLTRPPTTHPDMSRTWDMYSEWPCTCWCWWKPPLFRVCYNIRWRGLTIEILPTMILFEYEKGHAIMENSFLFDPHPTAIPFIHSWSGWTSIPIPNGYMTLGGNGQKVPGFTDIYGPLVVGGRLHP